jgi:hypothetical protein
MLVLFGPALLLALGATACGRNDEHLTGTGPSAPPTASGASSPSDAVPPLRRPKPTVPLSVTPPPIKPLSAPDVPAG